MSGNYQESGAMLSKRLPRVNECNGDLTPIDEIAYKVGVCRYESDRTNDNFWVARH
jgi:hypothetical protein